MREGPKSIAVQEPKENSHAGIVLKLAREGLPKGLRATPSRGVLSKWVMTMVTQKRYEVSIQVISPGLTTYLTYTAPLSAATPPSPSNPQLPSARLRTSSRGSRLQAPGVPNSTTAPHVRSKGRKPPGCEDEGGPRSFPRKVQLP